MPQYEYECNNHGVFTKLFKTFTAAAKEEDYSTCPQCSPKQVTVVLPTAKGFDLVNRPEATYQELCPRVVSMPLQAHLYGNPDGYHNPSPAKRFTTKTVSQRDGNKWSGA